MTKNNKKCFLILVRGLGGSGKTTLSTGLSKRLCLPLFNRDDIKPVLRHAIDNIETVTDISYSIMNALAKIQLKNNVSTIIDANSRFISMENEYIKSCRQLGVEFAVINCICSDHSIWRKRITNRGATHELSFEETRDMIFEKYISPNQITIDNCSLKRHQALTKCLDWLNELEVKTIESKSINSKARGK